MGLDKLPAVDDQAIATAWQTHHVDLKAHKNIYGIELNQQPYVVRFTTLAEARDLETNATLANIVGMKTVQCLALPYTVKELSFKNEKGRICDGVLLMEKAEGNSFDTFDNFVLHDKLTSDPAFADIMLHDLVGAAVTNNHDASSTNGFYNEATKEHRWIDPEMGLAGNEELDPHEIINLYNIENAAVSAYFPNVQNNAMADEKISVIAETMIERVEASRMLYADNAVMLGYHDRLQDRAQSLIIKKSI